MRIATWNIERLGRKKVLPQITLECKQINADILILTETDEQVRLPYRNYFHTPMLKEIRPGYYKPTENRVSIYTNYDFVRYHDTYDKYTALCVELKTEHGNLVVYGTIIGIEGNRRTSFKEDLAKQISDYRKLTSNGSNICVSGDYNISFSDNYYYTKLGRNTLIKSFEENHAQIITKDVPQCIDHIALSKAFIGNASVQITEWNIDKSLSDHKGIVANILF